MSATNYWNYDHPTFQVLQQATRPVQIAAVAKIPLAGFRSKLKAIVSNISVVVESLASATIILTLLFNGSVAAVLTLVNSANTIQAFTLTSNRTLDTMADHFDVGSTQGEGQIYIIYQYRVVPQDITTFGTNLI